MKKIIYIFISLFLLIPFIVSAVGVSVSPVKSEINYQKNNTTYLRIKNISKEVVSISIYPDEFIENIKIYPDEVQLLPEQITRIEINTDFEKEKKDQIYSTNISIVSKSLDKKSFNASSGIKIPIKIIFERDNNYTKIFLYFTSTILILGIIFIILSKYNNRKNKITNKIKKIFQKKSKKSYKNFFNLLK